MDNSSILFCCATELELQVLPVGVGIHHISRIGISETILSLFPLLQEKKVSRVINIGIAGAYKKELSLKLGDVVLSTYQCYADLGFQMEDGSFKPLAYANFAKNQNNNFALAEYPVWMLNDKEFTFNVNKVKSGTVQQCTGTEKTGEERGRLHNIEAENMEGAAVVQLAYYFNIPVWEIRGISNWASCRKMDLNNIKEACNNLKQYLYWMVNQPKWGKRWL